MIGNADEGVRNETARCAGSLGRVDLAGAVAEQAEHDRLWPCWAAVLLGRERSAERLWALASTLSPPCHAHVALRAVPAETAAAWLIDYQEHAPARDVIDAAIYSGCTTWLERFVAHLEAPETRRLAAWAYSVTSGFDLAEATGAPPPNFRSGPSDDPSDDNVAMDPDDELPWPDVAALRAHWQAQQAAVPADERWLLGCSITPDSSAEVLSGGRHLARQLAAFDIALTKPQTPLPEVRARWKPR